MANERIKLLATVLGNVAAGSIIAGIVAAPETARIWTTISLANMVAAWLVLGRGDYASIDGLSFPGHNVLH
jgi:hypothetical protein